jgi:hypothetical protein
MEPAASTTNQEEGAAPSKTLACTMQHDIKSQMINPHIHILPTSLVSF